MSDLVVGDINGDGAADVIHKDWNFVSLGGNSAWETTMLNSEIDFDQSLLLVDMGNDHQTDIVRAVGSAFEVSWGGQTAFEPVGNRAFFHSGLMHGDFDGDGIKDTKIISASGFDVQDIALGDFNDDGTTDIFRINGNRWQYANGGGEEWTDLQMSGVPISELAFGDFNGDRKTDVFYSHDIGNVNVWKVSWSGLTSWVNLNNSTADFSNLIFADINGDGRCDVAHASNGAVRVSLGGSQLWKNWNQ